MSYSNIESTLKFIKAKVSKDRDILNIAIPKHYKNFESKIKDCEQELLLNHQARKLRLHLGDIEVPVETKEVSVTIITEINDELIRLVGDNDYIAVDFETSSPDALTCDIIAVGLTFLNGKETFYIPIAHNNYDKNLHLDVVAEFLEYAAQRTSFIVHNLSFEKKLLDRLNIVANFEDTMILNYLKGGLRSNKLKEVVKHRLNARMTTYDEVVGTGRKKKLYADVPVVEGAHYCGADTYYTSLLYELLIDDVPKSLYDLDKSSALTCSDMETSGVLIDTNKLNNLRNFCNLRMSRIQNIINSNVKQEINLNSPKQLGELLYNKMKLDVVKYTDSNKPSTDTESISELLKSNPDNKILKYISDYRNMSKIVGTYINKILDNINESTNRYHPYFNFVGAETGRLSSNFQQLPKSGKGYLVREAVVAPENNYVVAADYSQVEIRILAHLMQDDNINNMIISGVDIHTATASIIFNIPIEDIDKDGAERNIAKTLNFAIIYGRGVSNIAKDLNINIQEAKSFLAKYMQSFPKLEDLKQQSIKEARIKGYSVTLAGRKRYIPDLKSTNHIKRSRAERQVFNAIIQGSAADLVRQVMPQCAKLFKSFGGEMIMQIHDEIVGYVPKSMLENFRSAMIKTMEVDNIAGVKLSVPLKVDIGYGLNYKEAK